MNILKVKHPKVKEIIAFLKAESVRTSFEHLTNEAVYAALLKEGYEIYHMLGRNLDETKLIHEIVILHEKDKDNDEGDGPFDDYEDYKNYILGEHHAEWGQAWINVVFLPHALFLKLNTLG